jgi:hypothetical protein
VKLKDLEIEIKEGVMLCATKEEMDHLRYRVRTYFATKKEADGISGRLKHMEDTWEKNADTTNSNYKKTRERPDKLRTDLNAAPSAHDNYHQETLDPVIRQVYQCLVSYLTLLPWLRDIAKRVP